MTALILLFGEIVPKSLALNFPLPWSRACAWFLVFLEPLFSPVVAAGSWLADVLVYRGSEAVGAAARQISRAEVLSLVEEVREQGALSPEETRLARRVVDFSVTELVAVMTPWVDVARVERDAPRRQVEALIRTSRHSRIPVVGSDADDVVGYLTAKTYLANPESELDEHLRPVLVLPGTHAAGAALHEMRALHRQLVLVVSEHGRTLGIVTVEDLVEEIVGEIYDEFETATELVIPLGEGRFRLSGRAPLDLVEERTGVRLEVSGEEFVTVNGLLFHLAGRLPARGDRIHWNGACFEILDVDRNRVTWCELAVPREPHAS
jgi:CBS domain containing-hemolysin-like protein